MTLSNWWQIDCFFLRGLLLITNRTKLIYLHGHKPVENDKLDVVVTLLHDQIDVTAGSSFHGSWSSWQSDLRKKWTILERKFETIIGDLNAESNKQILFILEKRSYQCSGGLVTNWWAVGVQEVVDAPDKARALGWISQTDFVDQLDNDQLQNIAEVLDLLDARAEKVQGPILVSVDQHHKRITFAWHVLKLNQQKFRVSSKRLKIGQN